MLSFASVIRSTGGCGVEGGGFPGMSAEGCAHPPPMATAMGGMHPTGMHICYRPHMEYGGRLCFHRHLSFCPQLEGVCLFPSCITGHITRGGVCLLRGGVCIKADLPSRQVSILEDTFNRRLVRILLECILVVKILAFPPPSKEVGDAVLKSRLLVKSTVQNFCNHKLIGTAAFWSPGCLKYARRKLPIPREKSLLAGMLITSRPLNQESH